MRVGTAAVPSGATTSTLLGSVTRWRRRDCRRHSNPSPVLECADEGHCAICVVTRSAYRAYSAYAAYVENDMVMRLRCNRKTGRQRVLHRNMAFHIIQNFPLSSFLGNFQVYRSNPCGQLHHKLQLNFLFPAYLDHSRRQRSIPRWRQCNYSWGNAKSRPPYQKEPEHDQWKADHEGQGYPQGEVRRGAATAASAHEQHCICRHWEVRRWPAFPQGGRRRGDRAARRRQDCRLEIRRAEETDALGRVAD
jgi:hypothetical protein